jgi:hypothetical protein
MRKYLLYPFTDQRGTDHHRGVKSDWEMAKGLTAYQLFTGDKNDQCLKGLTDEQLYVFGHCDAGTHKLYSWDQKSKLKVEAVVTLLKDAKGLQPDKFTGKIKVWACYSASPSSSYFSLKTSSAFVQEFANQMHAAGYTNCGYFGYADSVLGGYQAFKDPSDPNDTGYHKVTESKKSRASAVQVQFYPQTKQKK